MSAAGSSFTVCLEVVIRPCREEDLPALEWFGLFASHRPLIRRVFEQHLRGEAVMLVAEVNGEASGQLWIDLQAGCDRRAAEIWAVRVLPCLHGQGIGARMMADAEALLRARGFQRVQLRVETDNPEARRLYEGLGYAFAGLVEAQDPPEHPEPARRTQWILAKELRVPAPFERVVP